MTRNGKIARLPKAVREQLNRRLADGEPGEPLLTWLNELPATKKVLAEHFGGSAVSKQNLSEWRTGGFVEWEAHEELMAKTQALASQAKDLSGVARSRLTEHLATVLSARYAALVMDWKGEPDEAFEKKARALRGLCRDVTELRRCDLRVARLNTEEKWHEHRREKDEQELLARFDQWLDNEEVREAYCKNWHNRAERVRLIRQAFGAPGDRPDHLDWVQLAEAAAAKARAASAAGEEQLRKNQAETAAARARFEREERERVGELGSDPAGGKSKPVKPCQTSFYAKGEGAFAGAEPGVRSAGCGAENSAEAETPGAPTGETDEFAIVREALRRPSVLRPGHGARAGFADEAGGEINRQDPTEHQEKGPGEDAETPSRRSPACEPSTSNAQVEESEKPEGENIAQASNCLGPAGPQNPASNIQLSTPNAAETTPPPQSPPPAEPATRENAPVIKPKKRWTLATAPTLEEALEYDTSHPNAAG